MSILAATRSSSFTPAGPSLAPAGLRPTRPQVAAAEEARHPGGAGVSSDRPEGMTLRETQPPAGLRPTRPQVAAAEGARHPGGPGVSSDRPEGMTLRETQPPAGLRPTRPQVAAAEEARHPGGPRVIRKPRARARGLRWRWLVRHPAGLRPAAACGPRVTRKPRARARGLRWRWLVRHPAGLRLAGVCDRPGAVAARHDDCSGGGCRGGKTR
jgi:hypothetical protein